MMDPVWQGLLSALIGLYYQCAFFMVNVAGLLGVTYRDANAGLFFVLWPGVTMALGLWVVWNQWVLWRLPRGKAPTNAGREERLHPSHPTGTGG